MSIECNAAAPNIKTQTINYNRNIDWTWRNYLVWDVYNKYNKNGNETLEADEIKAMRADFKKYDKRFLAKKLGCSLADINAAEKKLATDCYTRDLYDVMNPGIFSSFDKAKTAKMLSNIDENNVMEIFEEYQAYTDDKHSIRNFKYSNHSLASDILNKYNFDEAAKILKNIVTAMSKAAQRDNIDIKSLVYAYNNAYKARDTKAMDNAVREISLRYSYAKKMTIGIKVHNADPNVPEAPITEKNMERLKGIAVERGMTPTKDIVGDGVLNNTPSEVVSGSARNVYSALNELLNHKVYGERIRSCFKKEDNIFAIYFPKNNSRFCMTENSLINESEVWNGTVGDGDISAMVAAIQNEMNYDNFKSNNYSEVKQYIINLFKPVL